ncbi:MAG: hypothetical protein ABJ092_16115 [Gillisia sp.]
MKLRKGLLVFLLIPFGVVSQNNLTGAEFYEIVRDIPAGQREQLIKKELLNGNYPDFITQFIPVEFSRKDANGAIKQVKIWVSPGYISIGTTQNYFIIPLLPHTAQELAMTLNSSLPTPAISDIIYDAAILQLEPFTYYPRENRNETVDFFYDHSRVIQAQIKSAGLEPGTFVAGIKKDIVISTKLNDKNRPGHVIIYGWHTGPGKPIQPESNIHINTYVDYSHGARLISNKVLIDNCEYNYEDVLKDPLLFPLLTNSSQPFATTRY